MKKSIKTMILPLNSEPQIAKFNEVVNGLMGVAGKAVLSMQYSTTTHNLQNDLADEKIDNYYSNGSVIGIASLIKDGDGNDCVQHIPFAIHSHFVMIVWSEDVQDVEEVIKEKENDQ